MPTFGDFSLQWLEREELGEECKSSSFSTISPPLDLSSWSNNLLARGETEEETYTQEDGNDQE
ncbi:hypothetical protein Taro_053170 [Colocasia esculenta]|uniref:Uncharacterized protein n=1 Tax=Colocasia esculenta TaxID=4460 RepID=A0A843XM95_COLES|nr:hypothetical protein [Colocasia esculenta]